MSWMVRAYSWCSRRRRPTISERRASVDSSVSTSAVSSLKVTSWLMDLGSLSSPTSPSNQPPASMPRDFPASARPHWPKCSSRKSFVERGQVADLADAPGVQILFGDFADAGNLADVERREEARFFARQHPQDAVGLGLIGGDFGDHARRRRCRWSSSARFRASRRRAGDARRERRAVQALGAGDDPCRLRRPRPFRPAARSFAGLRRPCASIRDSARDGRRRRWRAGRGGAAVRSGMAECTPNLRAA